MVHTEIKGWEAAREEACPIRFVVFVDEQKVPREIELDEHDALSLHVIARAEAGAAGRAVGTGRLLPVEGRAPDTVSHVGRMAVREWRGRGIGAAMLDALLQAAAARGDAVVALSAQVQAIGFYRRYGFVEAGGRYMDAGIEHQEMRRVLAASGRAAPA